MEIHAATAYLGDAATTVLFSTVQAGAEIAGVAGGLGAVGSTVKGLFATGAEDATGGLEEVAARGLSRASVVSPARAEAFLIEKGFDPVDAKSYIGSFDGPITARIVRPGEDFLRYAGKPNGSGGFLTTTLFSDPASAVDGLYLKPFGNPATYVQQVTSSGRSIVLEGAIKNGGNDINQTLIHDRDAFTFGIGQGY